MVSHRRTFGCVQRMRTGVDRLRWTDAGRRRSETVYGSRHDAERRLAEIQTATDERRPSMQTIGEIFDALVVPEMERTLAPRSLKNQHSVWSLHIAPRWSDVYADELRAADVQSWLLGLPQNSAQRALAILRSVMRHALMLGMVASSPLSVSFEMPKSKTREVSHEIVHSDADMARYLAAVHGCEIEGAIILMACGGLRVGEALGVKACEIERREVAGKCAAVVTVARQALAEGGVALDADGSERLKTAHSARTAVVIGESAERLLALADAASDRGDVYLSDDGYGEPIGSTAARTLWRKAIARAGLPDMLMRNLRPSYATSVHFGQGIATEDVARLMGHSKPTITFGVYERPDADDVLAIFDC